MVSDADTTRRNKIRKISFGLELKIHLRTNTSRICVLVFLQEVMLVNVRSREPDRSYVD